MSRQYPSDALSPPEACVFQFFSYHDGSDRDGATSEYEYGGGNVFDSETREPKWLMRDEVKYGGGTQETFNRQLTVPPTSHRRPVFFNQTHRQSVIISESRGHETAVIVQKHPGGRSSGAPQNIKYNHVTFPTAPSGPLS